MRQIDRPNLRTEKLYLLRDIADLGVFPRGTSYRSLLRWAKDGKLNHSGVNVYLEYVISPRGCATTVEACLRFMEALDQ